jgi:dsRNA-specific ribonuclease
MPKINIESEKYEILEARGKEKGFEDTEKYIDHLISQIVEKITKEKKEEQYSNEEDEEVKQKLKDLGYM